MPRPKTSLGCLRIISVLTADVFLLSCTLTALILPYLPIRYDVFGLASHYSLYLQISAIATIVGLWGCFRKQPTICRFFSHYMLTDLLISSLPRFLLLLSIFKMEEIPDLPGAGKWAGGSLYDNSPVLLTSRIADPSGIPLLDALITELIVHLTTVYRNQTEGMGEMQYFIFASLLKVGFVGLLAGCSYAQWQGSSCIREYTQRLERLRADALNGLGMGGKGGLRRLSAPSQMSDSDLEDWEEYRDTVEEKVA